MSVVNPLPIISEPVRTALRLLILGSLLLAVLYILRPFLPSMLWSAFIVITVWPGLAWLQSRFRWNRAACALALAVVLVGFVIGPLMAGIFTLVEHGETLFQDTKAAVEKIPDHPPAWVGELPLVGSGLAQTWRDVASGGAGLRARLGPVAVSYTHLGQFGGIQLMQPFGGLGAGESLDQGLEQGAIQALSLIHI